MRTDLLVTGMRNNASRERVAEELATVAGVRDVDVSLARARAAVWHARSCNPERLLRAVARSGCRAERIGRRERQGDDQ